MKKKDDSAVIGHRLTLSYLGTPFMGWQRQDGLVTVQGEVERVLAEIWKTPVHAEASGRTDAGVHALAQVVSFLAPRKLEAAALQRAMNFHLPDEIRVRDARLVRADFHARFDATGKTYEYRIVNLPFLDPFLLGRAWHVPHRLDFDGMREAASHLEGEHDFAAFASNPGYERRSTVRDLRRLSVSHRAGKVLVTATASGFLYRMVRNLTGALVQVGKGKASPGDIRRILESKTRALAPAGAPACGLYLKRVLYGSPGAKAATGSDELE